MKEFFSPFDLYMHLRRQYGMEGKQPWEFIGQIDVEGYADAVLHGEHFHGEAIDDPVNPGYLLTVTNLS